MNQQRIFSTARVRGPTGWLGRGFACVLGRLRVQVTFFWRTDR